MKDSIQWHPVVRVIKYEPDTVRDIVNYLGYEPTGNDLRWLEQTHGLSADAITEVEGNALVNVGLQRIGDLIVANGSPQAFTATRGMGGVGDSAAATTGGMTALQGSNQYYKAIDAAPSSSTGVISASTTFQTGDANYSWAEWAWAIATASPVSSASFATATTSGVMLNRKAQSLGTKTAGAVWTLQASVTLS